MSRSSLNPGWVGGVDIPMGWDKAVALCPICRCENPDAEEDQPCSECRATCDGCGAEFEPWKDGDEIRNDFCELCWNKE